MRRAQLNSMNGSGADESEIESELSALTAEINSFVMRSRRRDMNDSGPEIPALQTSPDMQEETQQ